MAHPAVMGLNSWKCEGNTTLSVLFFPFREATPNHLVSSVVITYPPSQRRTPMTNDIKIILLVIIACLVFLLMTFGFK